MAKPTSSRFGRADGGQRARFDAQPIGDQARQHDDADDEGHDHRQDGDGQVVEHLAHRLQERPAVCARHEDAVERVEQAHPGGEQHGQHQDGVPRQRECRRARREHQQCHLRRRIEPQAHQKAHGVEMPGLADPAHHPGQQSGQKTPILKLPFEFGLVEVAVAHGAENLGDSHDGEEIRQPDQDQEGPGDERPDQPERLQHRRTLVLHGSDDGAHADREQKRQPEHDAGMPEREPEAGGQRPRALADQLAGRVVDHGDVVGVERMPHTQR